MFARTIGETTDVVSKEMYTFEDRGGESITLRPEFTAGICRAYLSEGWQQFAPLKVATHGPAFRYERPQKGRFRQFHQLDAEDHRRGRSGGGRRVAVARRSVAQGARHSEGVTLQLNTLGDPETRDAWRSALVEYFQAHRSALSEDSLARLERNPLRILDTQGPEDRPIADAAPAIDDFLTREAADFFAQVTAGLDAAGVQVDAQPAARARPRLLSSHGVRVRHRSARRAGNGDRRRPLRRPDRSARRSAYAGGRLGGGHRAAGDDDRSAASRKRRSVAVVPLGERAEAEAQRIVAGFAARASRPTWPIAAT